MDIASHEHCPAVAFGALRIVNGWKRIYGFAASILVEVVLFNGKKRGTSSVFLASFRWRARTCSMIRIPDTAEHSINHNRGISPESIDTIAPASADNAAPPPIMIALPMPEAVPVKFGRAESIPAVAFGMVIPLPNPTKHINPKKLRLEPYPT